MRKILLTAREQEKYEVIKAVSDGRKSVTRAAIELSLTERSIRRLRQRYRENGKGTFEHGNHRLHTRLKYPVELQRKIFNLYQNKYQTNNLLQFTEYLAEYENIVVSYSWLLKFMRRRHVVTDQTHRATVRQIRKELVLKQQHGILSKRDEALLNQTATLDPIKAHPSRPRRKYFGELLQMDASQEYWFGSTKTFLHIAIDDATGLLVGAWFDTQETLAGYYQVFARILENYGAPIEILTDRRTVFEHKKKAHPTMTSDTLTNFGYACHNLGTKLRTSSTPQAKGRVERVFRTLQSRLINDLRLKRITDLNGANDYLVNQYLPKFNHQFGHPLKNTMNVFEAQMKPKEIEMYLTRMEVRTIDHGHSLHFEGKLWSLRDDNGPIFLNPKTKVEVIKTYLGNYFVTYGDAVYRMVPIKKREELSIEIDFELSHEPKYKGHVPPANHPWRSDRRRKFEEAQKIYYQKLRI